MNRHPMSIVIVGPPPTNPISSALEQLYVAYFNRPADIGGFLFWTSAIRQSGVTLAAIGEAFATAPEYIAAYAGLSNDQIVNKVYQNLFGRDAESGGKAYWVDLLERRLITVANVVTQVAAGAVGSDREVIQAKTAAALAFTTALESEAAPFYQGPAAIAVAKAFISSIVDNASYIKNTTPAALQKVFDDMSVAYNPMLAPVTFNLTAATDLIAPTDLAQLPGKDVANGTATANGNSISQTFDGLDSIDLGAGRDTLNLTALTGSTWVVPTTVRVANVETANVTADQGIVMDTRAWSGLSQVNLTAGAAGTVTAAAGTNITATFVLGTGAGVVDGGKNVAITVTGARFGSDGISLGHTLAPTENVTINYNAVDAGAYGALNVTGGNLVTINQSHTNGVNTSAINAPVTVTGTHDTSEVIINNAAAVQASATQAGIELNRVVITDANFGSTTARGSIGQIAVSNYSSLVINDSALFDLSLSGGAGDVTISNGGLVGASDKILFLELNGVRSGTLTDASGANGVYSRLNIHAYGADSTTGIRFNALETLNVSGNSHLTLLSDNGLLALKSLHVSDKAGISGNFSATALTRVDTSYSTGTTSVVIDGSKTDFIGGAGADSVTLTGVGLNHVVKLGTGADRVIINAISPSLNNYGVIQEVHGGVTLGFADHGNETFASAKQELAAGAGFRDYADAVIRQGGNASGNGAIGWFQFGGDTYVVESRHDGSAPTAGFTSGTDIIVRLTGLVDLSSAGFADGLLTVK
jgi:Domain of unknown function (DUF4214)